MNETLKTIDQMRSVRSFTDQLISKEDLDTILEASIRTANSSARQCYSIIVTEDKEKMKGICGCSGAVALVYCVDYNRLNDIADYMKQDFKKSMTSGFITGSTDAVLAAQTAVIAAKSLGIDSLITNGIHRQDLRKVYQLLKLPESYCFPLMVLLLGYAESPVNPELGRIKTGVIHFDEYQHLSEKEIQTEIDMSDTIELKYGMSASCKWREAGFVHYYDWLFTAWTRTQEDVFYPILKETKFLP